MKRINHLCGLDTDEHLAEHRTCLASSLAFARARLHPSVAFRPSASQFSI